MLWGKRLAQSPVLFHHVSFVDGFVFMLDLQQSVVGLEVVMRYKENVQ
jgi:hypothetical protein